MAWPSKGTSPVGRSMSESKLGREGRAGDINMGAISKKKRMRQSMKNTQKDKSSFFGPQNTDVSNNLKQFIAVHLNFLDDEDKVIR